MQTTDNVTLAREYIRAIEEGATGERLASFFTSDVEQEEFPNRLMPNGARRNLAQLLEGAERGQGIMASQRFEVLECVAQGDRVALELRWTGILGRKIAQLPDEMRARFAVFLEFRDGKIVRQRNYDCYEPW